MGVPKRVYIKVLAEFGLDGKITPLSIELDDGRKYELDRLVRVERRASNTGGTTLRYEVKVRGQTRFLFRDIYSNQWFVEVN